MLCLSFAVINMDKLWSKRQRRRGILTWQLIQQPKREPTNSQEVLHVDMTVMASDSVQAVT